jgi:spore germination protein GerM
MSARRWLTWIGGLLAVGAFAWGATWMLARQDRQAPPVEASGPAALQVAHITATLFYGSPDGFSLTPVRREVQLDDGVVAQGRQVLLVQLQPAPTGAISVIPAATVLRAFYVTRQGEAFVDLSAEVVSGHPGGAQNEWLTIQAIVHAVTANLPAVRRVQILVEGREVDTIAGHLDLRRPLAPDAGILIENEP